MPSHQHSVRHPPKRLDRGPQPAFPQRFPSKRHTTGSKTGEDVALGPQAFIETRRESGLPNEEKPEPGRVRPPAVRAPPKHERPQSKLCGGHGRRSGEIEFQRDVKLPCWWRRIGASISRHLVADIPSHSFISKAEHDRQPSLGNPSSTLLRI